MERRTCKLCSRTFSNGRALGGHMRSHMTILSPSPQTPKTQVAENDSPSSSSSDDDEEEDDGKPPYYVLRENPQKSFRLADPEFSFAVDASSIVQDRESETESSHCRRSKRPRKSPNLEPGLDPDPDPLSSVSDTTTEEDVARCLMMLSRDIWMTDESSKKATDDEVSEDYKEEEEESYEKLKFISKGRSRYQCETCKKVFRSYQALGGHRASHKKIRGSTTDVVRAQVADSDRRRIHQCPVCHRVFSSGQALGGHKRSHVSASAAASPSAASMIDLNLPAPIEDDDISAVSDAEFVDPAK